MWDGYLRRIDIAKHRFLVSSADAKVDRFATYWKDLKARHFEKSELDKMLCEGFIKPANTKWAA